MKASVYKLRVPDEIAGLLRNLHPQLKRKLKASLREIISAPSSGKPLKGDLTGFWSYRVSRYRIVYRFSGSRIIEIYAVGPRENIYADTLRLARRDQKKT